MIKKTKILVKSIDKKTAQKSNPFSCDFPDKHIIVEINDQLLDSNSVNKKRKAVIVAEQSNIVAITLLKSRQKFDKRKHMKLEDTPHYKKKGTVFSANRSIDTKTHDNQFFVKSNMKKTNTKLGKKDSENLENFINTKENRKKLK